MTEQRESTHLYGTADPANRTPPGPEGLRGEGSASDAPPGLAHVTFLDGGGHVMVEETSGSAYAEATGVAGLTADAPPAPPRAIHIEDKPSPELSPAARVLLTVAGFGAGYLLGRVVTGQPRRPEKSVETVIVTAEPTTPLLFIDPLATEAVESPALAAHPS